jgi:hypothetical protein
MYGPMNALSQRPRLHNTKDRTPFIDAFYSIVKVINVMGIHDVNLLNE